MDFAEELTPRRRPSNPIDFKHLWRANFPTNLDSGEHNIQIKVKDMFGRTFIQESSYRIEEAKKRSDL